MHQRLRATGILWVAVAAGICLGASGRLPAPSRNGVPQQGRDNVEVTVSASAMCGVPSGPYAHIYITVTDVAASRSSASAANDSSLVDLTPHLSTHPEQIDLVETPTSGCYLAMLGGGAAPPGVYKSLRVTLLHEASELGAMAGRNRCAAAGTANCVVLNGGAVLPLTVPPNGWFDIGANELAGGEFAIGSSGVTQLNISVDGCDSVISEVSPETNGRYVFVASASAALLDRAAAIAGRVVDAATGAAIDGRVIVAIERKDAAGVGRIVLAATPGADGSFLLCAVAPGEYDLAALAVSGTRVSYVPVILLNVPAGAAVGEIGLERAGTINAEPATVVGQVSLLAGTNVGYGSVRISALMSLGPESSATTFTIPLPQSPAGTLRVSGPGAIPYSFTMPAANPRIGAFSKGRMRFSQDTSRAPELRIEADGCGTTKTTLAAIPVTAGGTASAPILTISTCSPISKK